MAYREDDDAALRRRQQLARELTRDALDAVARRRLESELAAIDAARIDAARVRLPQVARARIASPCAEKWETMLGDGAVRSCTRCEKEVFDLSQMTLGQAEALIAERSGDEICARLFRRPDGTMMFADCFVGAYGVAKRQSAIGGAALLVGSAALAWANQMPPPAPCAGPWSDLLGSVVFVPETGGPPREVLDPSSYSGMGGAISVIDPVALTAASHPRGRVTIGAPTPLADDTFDAPLVGRALRARSASIRSCYTRELRRDPALAGHIAIRMTIAPSGHATTVFPTITFAGADTVTECIVRAAQDLRFDASPAEPTTYDIAFDLAPETHAGPRS